MIELQLKIDGKKKIFKANKVNPKTMRNLIVFYEKFEKEEFSELEALDAMIMIAVDVFKNPNLDFDAVLDGFDSFEEMMQALEKVMAQIQETESDGKKSKKEKK
ncbi:MAG: hypothetical protein L0M06_09110 [Enterococcus sp.]|jgi:hypothetical protein|uniref:phage tail assembly chaperone G n=1 Tax=Enterococcus sp. TaxID=35783 RepID=UPI00204F22A6|nr:hypothetical protein [Enterococcus sp.]DAL95835.1 MAG TPA: hypothetical protein [Caudoviricetes sp.]MDN6002628.1 hypothetical protein [Enterococcus sp.]MDN6560012.1 hypothetical protein [Enterococcus sp.]MDN6753317.1 hypothetical protein [Enterococcus sp.]MDN6776701.1 hypothetical protein [Enterococcus sp.]